MEKYFIVTEESSLYGDFMAYKENLRMVNELVKKFMEKHGIETSYYSPTTEKLYIQPTENDIQKFDSVLAKPVEGGLRAFKKNSLIGKDWCNRLKEANLKVLHKPFVPFYFRRALGGYYQTRLFEIDGTVYCSINANYTHLEATKGMVEMKASEFFRIIEDYESRNQGGKEDV
jgi:hypothetical protein